MRGGYSVYPRTRGSDRNASGCFTRYRARRSSERLGEEVEAYVVLKRETLSESDFTAWCKTQFAANKYPRYVEFRSELPIGNTGKISKLLLREEVTVA